MDGTLARVEPAYWHLAEGDVVRTLGPEVADLAESAAYGPDADQAALLGGIFARGGSGKSVAFEVCLVACRRNIKSSTLTMAGLGWLFLLGIDPVVWTAHEWDTVDEQVREFDKIIGGDPWLRRRVRAFNRAQRDASIVTRNGGRMIFKTRTPGGGRGLDGEKVVLDEAWKARKAHTGSLIPTMSARSVGGDPQLFYGSSAAHVDSEVLHPVIRRGRAAATSPRAALRERRLMFAEWCAPDPEVACAAGAACTHALDTPGCGCDDPAMVGLANPAAGRRISMEFILTSERRAMDPAEYGRERMGWHDAAAGEAEVIPLGEWAGLADPRSEPSGPVALSVVYTSDKRRAAIGLYGQRADGAGHAELADYLDSTDMVAPRVRQIVSKARKAGRDVVGVAVDGLAHEAACIKPLTAARSAPVVVMKTGQVAEAFAGFFEAVTQSRDCWHRGQEELTLAVMGATTRLVGDAGEAWARRASGVEIAPAVAVTNARWLWLEKAPATGVEPGVWAL